MRSGRSLASVSVRLGFSSYRRRRWVTRQLSERASGGPQSEWLSAWAAVAAYLLLPRLVPGPIMIPRNAILSINIPAIGARAAEGRGGACCRLLETCGCAASTPRPSVSRSVRVGSRYRPCHPGPRFTSTTLKSTSCRPCRQAVTQSARTCSPSLVAPPLQKKARLGQRAWLRRDRRAGPGRGWELHLYGVQAVAPLLPNAAVPSS